MNSDAHTQTEAIRELLAQLLACEDPEGYAQAAAGLEELDALVARLEQLTEAAHEVLDYENAPSRASLSKLRAVLAAAGSSANPEESEVEFDPFDIPISASVSPCFVNCGQPACQRLGCVRVYNDHHRAGSSAEDTQP